MLEGFIDVSAILRCGIYALVREGVVVYVGQSKKMLGRIAAHKSNWGKKSMPAWMPVSLRGVLFDSAYVLPCRVEDLDRLERALIDLYKPKYNINLKTPDPVSTPLTIRVDGKVVATMNDVYKPCPKFERRI